MGEGHLVSSAHQGRLFLVTTVILEEDGYPYLGQKVTPQQGSTTPWGTQEARGTDTTTDIHPSPLLPHQNLFQDSEAKMTEVCLSTPDLSPELHRLSRGLRKSSSEPQLAVESPEALLKTWTVESTVSDLARLGWT